MTDITSVLWFSSLNFEVMTVQCRKRDCYLTNDRLPANAQFSIVLKYQESVYFGKNAVESETPFGTKINHLTKLYQKEGERYKETKMVLTSVFIIPCFVLCSSLTLRSSIEISSSLKTAPNQNHKQAPCPSFCRVLVSDMG